MGGIICLKLVEEGIDYSGLAMICTPLIDKAPKINLAVLSLFNRLISKGKIKSYLEGFDDIANGKIRLPKIKIEKPFLVIYGNYDFLIKLSNGECYKKLKPNKVVYGNFGHLAPLIHPSKLINILRNFLENN